MKTALAASALLLVCTAGTSCIGAGSASSNSKTCLVHSRGYAPVSVEGLPVALTVEAMIPRNDNLLVVGSDGLLIRRTQEGWTAMGEPLLGVIKRADDRYEGIPAPVPARHYVVRSAAALAASGDGWQVAFVSGPRTDSGPRIQGTLWLGHLGEEGQWQDLEEIPLPEGLNPDWTQLRLAEADSHRLLAVPVESEAQPRHLLMVRVATDSVSYSVLSEQAAYIDFTSAPGREDSPWMVVIHPGGSPAWGDDANSVFLYHESDDEWKRVATLYNSATMAPAHHVRLAGVSAAWIAGDPMALFHALVVPDVRIPRQKIDLGPGSTGISIAKWGESVVVLVQKRKALMSPDSLVLHGFAAGAPPVRIWQGKDPFFGPPEMVETAQGDLLTAGLIISDSAANPPLSTQVLTLTSACSDPPPR